MMANHSRPLLLMPCTSTGLHRHLVRMVTKPPRGLALLAVVLESMHLILASKEGKIGAPCLEVNKDDFVEVAPVAAGEAFDDNGIWSGVRNAAGVYQIGVSDLIEESNSAVETIRTDKEILTKLVTYVIVAATICLFKDNHHFTTDNCDKLKKILEGGGALGQLKSLGLDTTKDGYLAALHRTLMHPVTMADKWEVAKAYGIDFVFRCRLTGFGAGNAKAGIIAAIFHNAQVDKALDVFLANVGGSTDDARIKIMNLHSKADSPDNSVQHCTNPRALRGWEFKDLSEHVAKGDVTCIMGCVHCVRGTFGGQKTFSDAHYFAQVGKAMERNFVRFGPRDRHRRTQTVWSVHHWHAVSGRHRR